MDASLSLTFSYVPGIIHTALNSGSGFEFVPYGNNALRVFKMVWN